MMATSPAAATKETEPQSKTEAEVRAWYSDAEQRLKDFKLSPEEQADLKRTLGIGKK